MKKCSVKLSPIFSPVSVTVFGNCLASFPTASYPRQVSYSVNSSPSALVPCAGRCCCRDCELIFHFLPNFLIFCCLDPFIIVSFNVAYLILGSFRSEEVIDFIFPSFLWSSVLSSECHPASFITHLSSSKDAVLIASLHFILLCVLIQHWIFAVFIRSMASSVLLFM